MAIPPHLAATAPQGILPFGINDRGQVAGEYQDAAGTFHGYVWESGRFRTIDLPGQTMDSASGINNRGQLTGRTGPLETSPAPIPNAQIATT